MYSIIGRPTTSPETQRRSVLSLQLQALFGPIPVGRVLASTEGAGVCRQSTPSAPAPVLGNVTGDFPVRESASRLIRLLANRTDLFWAASRCRRAYKLAVGIHRRSRGRGRKDCGQSRAPVYRRSVRRDPIAISTLYLPQEGFTIAASNARALVSAENGGLGQASRRERPPSTPSARGQSSQLLAHARALPLLRLPFSTPCSGRSRSGEGRRLP